MSLKYLRTFWTLKIFYKGYYSILTSLSVIKNIFSINKVVDLEENVVSASCGEASASCGEASASYYQASTNSDMLFNQQLFLLEALLYLCMLFACILF